MELSGKTAVVTGSSKGIGQGIAVALAKEGANVAVTYNNAPPDATLEMINAFGGVASAFPLNAESRESINVLMGAAADKYGGIDILVNNAAVQPNKWVLEYTEEEYDLVMRVNLTGYWRCIQEAAPYLKQSACGRVINVASIHAVRPTGFDMGYAMSKGGVRMLTREAAIALSPWKVTVNSINFGAVAIGKKSGNWFMKPPKRLPTKKQPGFHFLSGRVGNIEDAGYYAVFLASEKSQYINGSSLRADGGMMLIAP